MLLTAAANCRRSPRSPSEHEADGCANTLTPGSYSSPLAHRTRSFWLQEAAQMAERVLEARAALAGGASGPPAGAAAGVKEEAAEEKAQELMAA